MQVTEAGGASLIGKYIRRSFSNFGIFTGKICGYNKSTHKHYIEYEVHALSSVQWAGA